MSDPYNLEFPIQRLGRLLIGWFEFSHADDFFPQIVGKLNYPERVDELQSGLL
jgi:hypothetical protein